MILSRAVSGDDVPFITVSADRLLAEMNALDASLGGPGDASVVAAEVTCEVYVNSDPDFPDATPSARPIGTLFLTSPYVSQFFAGGVEGCDYALRFKLTLSSDEVITETILVPVRKYP